MADSGREGEIVARVGVGEKAGRFKHLARVLPLVLGVRAIEFSPCHNSFPQTPSPGVRTDICPSVSVQYFLASEGRRVAVADQMR